MPVLTPRNTKRATRNEGSPRFMIFAKAAAIAGLALGMVTSSVAEVQGAPSTGTISTPLPDTGITAKQCYQAGSDELVSCTSAAAIALNAKQDGMLGRDVDKPANGDGRLGFSFREVMGGCVKDNLTGLVWEVKATDSGTRDRYKSFTNYGDGRRGDASEYVSAVNKTSLCGYSDWRLPTVDELQSIVDYSTANPGPTVDVEWFPYTSTYIYWTSTPSAEDDKNAWIIDFFQGRVDYDRRSSLNFVRLVR